jgi:hypothetical protein
VVEWVEVDQLVDILRSIVARCPRDSVENRVRAGDASE